jgi:outer membrane lipoprotein SlyB
MHPSTAAIRPRPVQSSFPRSAWVVIGLLGTTVAALGAVLVMRSPASESVEPAPQVSYATDMAPSASGSKPPPVAGNQPVSPVESAIPAVAKTTPRQQAPTRAPTHSGESVAAAPAARGGSHATPAAMVSVCNSCGVVEAVEPVQREGKGSGVGAVAGGVVGGALGNRMGAGTGKTAMTVLGVVGGGLAGHAIEKKVKTETVYRVKVRMEDGSVRSITQTKSMSVGTHVTVQGDTLKVTPPPAQVARSSA